MKPSIFSKSFFFILFLPIMAFSQNTIKGIVKGKDGMVISDVKVEIFETFFKTYTNRYGAFEFSKLDPGDYQLNISLIGFEPIIKKVKLTEKDLNLSIVLTKYSKLINEVTVSAIRANEKTPTTYSELQVKEIEQGNFGQDLPYILSATPSTVVTSDAGAGVGYTGIRIRGVDPTRTNVTINGVPINDSESHGMYWVNMPDLSSSINNIQVQRGVGTSSNGASAFGASINVQTNTLNKEPYSTSDNSYGSFNTWRNTVKAGTGLLKDKFIFDTRLSRIKSDGYVDRSDADLKSYYLSGALLGDKSILRATLFSGKEKTSQAWYGTPESVVHGIEEDIIAYADRNYIYGSDRDNLLNSGRKYNFYTYDNEVDNYQQDHYQLHFNRSFNNNFNLTTAAHYTRGRGYFEQYKVDEDFVDYGLDTIFISGDTINTTDLIRRRWLDNHFFGGIFSLSYDKNEFNVIFGGGANQYKGGHFGEIIWAEYSSNSQIRDRYYDNDAEKFEAHTYIKSNYNFDDLTLYGDLQFRLINYNFLGIDDVNGSIEEVNQTRNFNFFNPKAGFMYDFNERNNAYASLAVANREPVRKDFRENTPQNQPKVEKLVNFESGYRYKGQNFMINANIYYMYYTDQLVLTGQINDVGDYTRTNVDESYRAGLELEAGFRISDKLIFNGNTTLSKNKIKEFNEYLDNYDREDGLQDIIEHSNTDLAFSPNIIASAGLLYTPLDRVSVNLFGKHVGDQFLDNTSTESRKLDSYTIFNLQLKYTINEGLFKETTFALLVNNLFNELYENNGYTWGYVYGGERTVENFYYPQAGRNFILRMLVKF